MMPLSTTQDRLNARTCFAGCRVVILWVLGLLAFVRAASATDPARLTVGTVRAFPGSTVQVPLHLRPGSNAPVAVAFQGDLHFQTTRLVAGPALSGSSLSGHAVASASVAPGVRRLVIHSRVNRALTAGVQAAFPFAVATDAPQGKLSLVLSNAILASSSGDRVVSVTRPGAIALNSVFIEADGTARFYLVVQPNLDYLVEASTNLMDWVAIATNRPPDALMEAADPEADQFPMRFYRARTATE